MKNGLNLLPIACAAFVLMACAGCEKKGPMQKAGEKVDQAAQKTGDVIKDAADKTKAAADNATK
jgi:hypothetical protein